MLARLALYGLPYGKWADDRDWAEGAGCRSWDSPAGRLPFERMVPTKKRREKVQTRLEQVDPRRGGGLSAARAGAERSITKQACRFSSAVSGGADDQQMVMA